MLNQDTCPHFKLDEWGVCHYLVNYELEDCHNNCNLDTLPNNPPVQEVLSEPQVYHSPRLTNNCITPHL